MIPPELMRRRLNSAAIVPNRPLEYLLDSHSDQSCGRPGVFSYSTSARSPPAVVISHRDIVSVPQTETTATTGRREAAFKKGEAKYRLRNRTYALLLEVE